MSSENRACERFESRIALYVEGDLAAAESRALERHLRSCPSCDALSRELAASQEALRRHMRPPFDEEVLARVRSGVLDRIRRPRVLPFRRRILREPRWWAAAAALVLAAGLAWLVAARRVPPPAPATKATVTETRQPSSAQRFETESPGPITVEASPTEPLTASAPPTAVLASPQAPPPAAKVRPPREALYIKLVSQERNLVIYWQAGPADDKETQDEPKTVI